MSEVYYMIQILGAILTESTDLRYGKVTTRYQPWD